MFLHKQIIWFKDLENKKILSLQFYKILSTYNAKIILFSTHSCTLTTPINYSCSWQKLFEFSEDDLKTLIKNYNNWWLSNPCKFETSAARSLVVMKFSCKQIWLKSHWIFYYIFVKFLLLPLSRGISQNLAKSTD